jgi:hypothetical protein
LLKNINRKKNGGISAVRLAFKEMSAVFR